MKSEITPFKLVNSATVRVPKSENRVTDQAQ